MRGLPVLLLASSLAAQPTPPSFARDVRPLLSDRCFACHGPDAGARKAGLRLDDRAAAVADRGARGGPAIVPGAPEHSLLLRRVTHPDPGERMPPPRSKLPGLSPDEVDLLRRWIAAGAPYDRHWSFRPLPAVVASPDPSARLVDAFVGARLRARGLGFSPEADRHALIRRVSLDLTGIPPTAEEVDRFVRDRQPYPLERLVDRLLASPRFGEHSAAAWLDAARYADTHGYQADREQRVWPWRDWVVRAFNNNLPHDRFLTWQLAGDLLPDAPRDARLATAFQRLHRQTEEGGTVEEEFRVEYVADRVDTFGTAMLGLTVGCARCHDHKFDPISQREYYQLAAFFDDIDESGQTSHFTDAVPVPALALPGPAVEAELARLAARIEQAEAALTQARAAVDPEGDAELAQPVAHFPLDGPQEGVQTIDGPQPVPGRHGGGYLLDGEDALAFGKVGSFHRAQPFSVGLWLRVPRAYDRAVVVHKTRAALDAASRGWQVLVEDGRLTACLAHMWPGDAIKVAAVTPLPTGRWVHVLLAYDGSSRAGGLALYADGARQDVEVVRDHLLRDIRYERGGEPALTIGQRFRDRGLDGGMVDDLQVFDLELSPLEAARLAGVEPDGQARAAHARMRAPAVAAARAALAALRDQRRRLVETVPQVMTMAETTPPRQAYLLERGAYDARGAPVQPDTPAALPPFGDRPRDRLGLAQWLVGPDHPLTARVAVNRFWRQLFGRGLVATPEDFGSQGAPPSHPALLDALARQFVQSGWDVKALLAELVTSRTYRQSAAVPADTPDPDNLWLGRAPRFRLSAEQLRDAALAASGLLVERLGGPPVRPYQPPGLWREVSGRRYVPSTGDGLYRRSLYTYWKRTSPPPAMVLFDAPRRLTCRVRRPRTETALQALVLLNDPQWVEAARVLAEDVVRSAPEDDARLRAVWLRLLCRPPSDAELAVLQRMLHEQRAAFASEPARARELLAVGARPADARLSAVEVAALAMVAQALMSHDAFVRR